jgi:Xaa-Pro aminopeptidase
VKPGAVCGDIDAIARSIIDKAGYAGAFGHSLGHGVGFEIHESPNFAPKSGTVLEPGMLVTVEPGIYLPGKLGVRIEDLVLVTETGCEVLSAASPK